MSSSTEIGTVRNVKTLGKSDPKYHKKLQKLRAKGWRIVYSATFITVLEKYHKLEAK